MKNYIGRHWNYNSSLDALTNSTAKDYNEGGGGYHEEGIVWTFVEDTDR